jgi:tetratricopeptide (TPR) repeat protein
LETITLNCLAKNPAERYATAGELADDLRRWLGNQTIKAKPPSLRQQLSKWASRHRPVVAAATAGLLLAAAGMGGGVAWVARDASARRERVELAVGAELRNALDLQERSKWLEALEVARRAQALLASGPAGEGLRERVRQTVSGLELVDRLQEVRLRAADTRNATDTNFDFAWLDQQYARTFREAGIDAEALAPAEVAARIPPAVHVPVAAALHDWAMRRRGQEKYSGGSWRHLLATALAVDPDEWHGRLMAAQEKKDLVTLVALATEDGVLDRLPASVNRLVMALRFAGARQEAVALARRAQRRYPDDFWVNFELSRCLEGMQSPPWDELVSLYMAMVALRPKNWFARESLGGTLREKGDLAGSVAVYLEAHRLQPGIAASHNNFGVTLARKGDLDGAITAFREALRLKPDNRMYLGNLANVLDEQGYALWDRGDRDGALASFRRKREVYEDGLRRYRGNLVASHGLACLLATCPDGRLRDPGRAVELGRWLTEEQPGEGKFWGVLGLAYYHAGRCLEAIPALERAARIKGSGDDVACEWFFLAMAHRQLGDLYRSALYYAAAAQWMDKYAPRERGLRRLRAEAAELLGIKETPTTDQPPAP